MFALLCFLVTIFFCAFSYALRAWGTLCRFAFQLPFPFLRSFIICVLGTRRSVLPLSWGDVCCFICLTGWVTHDPSTGVRATTSLGGGESAVNCLFSPLPTVFSRALFSTILPTLGENGRAEPLSRFHEKDFIPLRFVQHCGNVQLGMSLGGGWGRRKAGDWGRKPRRGRGIAAGLPPFPWVVSPRYR